MKDHPFQPTVMLLLYAGVRPHEIYDFDVDRDVDFNAKTITLTVFAHIGPDNNTLIFDGKGKTKLAKRTVALFPQLEQYLIGKHGRLIVPKKAEEMTLKVFTNAWKTYINACLRKINGCQKRWYGRRKCDQENLARFNELVAQGKHEEAEQYRLPPWKDFKITPYDMRASFCSYCRDKKIDINIVKEWMGHSDLKMIASIYDQPNNERKQQALQMIVDDYEKQTKGSQRFNLTE